MPKLLQVPLRQSDPAALGAGLQEFLEREFHQTSANVRRDCQLIDKMRTRALDGSLPSLFEYYANLCGLMTRFPVELTTDFAWYGSLGYTQSGPVRSASLRFEQINIVHNVGALYSHLAAQQLASDSKGCKFAYNYFQFAAGCFRYIVDILLPALVEHAPPLDLNSAVHETLYYICLAQAQESFWQKAVIEQSKNGTISKLAAQVAVYYGDALTFAVRCAVLRTEWIRHLKIKKAHFSAVAQYRASKECLETEKYDLEVARLRAAKEAANIAFPSGEAPSEAIDDLKDLQERIRSDLERAERDNDLIYQKLVPSVSSLPVISPISMAKAVVPPEIKEPTKDGLLFSYILPYAVYQAASAYKEQLVSYVETAFVSQSKVISTEFQRVLEELGLPGSLEAVEKPQGLPGSLTSHIAELEACGGLAELQRALADVSTLARRAGQVLDEGAEHLKYEENEDRMMREREGTARWRRPESRVAAAVLWERLGRAREMQKAAAEGDARVLAKFKLTEPYLVEMTQGAEHVAQIIPDAFAGNGGLAGSNNNDGYLEHVMQRLKEALLRARGAETRRREYAASQVQAAANVDMLGEIIDDYNSRWGVPGEEGGGELQASSFEPIYKRHLKRYEISAPEWVKQERSLQVELVSLIKRLNEEFLAARETDDRTIARENMIQNLEVAFFKFVELMGDVEEARRFYNTFNESAVQFETACKTYVYERRVEGRKLEAAIAEEHDESVAGAGAGAGAGVTASPTPAAVLNSVQEQQTGSTAGSTSGSVSSTPTPYRNRVWTPGSEIRFG
ncbi:uncharacterized protein SAPINGB_P000373 [Magnusiomyces paraingens]|uniref:BRO1 domain-containing protein n=1 Tax=Magnusiomyces paraingens TaxID=2606893 RepID=A0A5E8AZC4_9ASCO|nr:uncharacterized protein SAPINGB_P000373 [Saprochaete ingens]VVT44308.1 unnamed protein product [Saprochaete ingens]